MYSLVFSALVATGIKLDRLVLFVKYFFPSLELFRGTPKTLGISPDGHLTGFAGQLVNNHLIRLLLYPN